MEPSPDATPPTPAGDGPPRPGRYAVPAACAALLAAVLAVYGQAGGHAFVLWDDDRYVTSNPAVLKGLGAEGVAWALTALEANNWHPLAWLSHMLDVSLFGLDAGGHHLTSVLLHGANAILLFLFLHRATGAFWRGLLVAALFALHPLHVESVAWVSERKDVLSGLFFLLTLLAWSRYAAAPSAGRYLAALLAFALGLAAKPMLVTVPFLLLLLDLWPLRRLSLPGAGGDGGGGGGSPPLSWGAALREKAPFLLLAAASSVVTVVAQRQGGVVAGHADLPLLSRLGNAVVSYGAYLWKTLLPAGLSVVYPHPASLHRGTPVLPFLAGAALLAGATALSWRERHRRPWLGVGWLWYAGMLVPVIGVVQVGAQAMADRYTYLPLVGIFVAFAWGCAEAAERLAVPPRARGAAAAALLLVLGALSFRQAGHWRDGYALFSHAVQAAEDNWMAHHVLGSYLHRDGRLAEARERYEAALRIKGDYPDTHQNLGSLLKDQGDLAGAERHFREAIRIDPAYYDAYLALAMMYYQEGVAPAAVPLLQRMLVLRPGDPMATGLLGMIAGGAPR